MAYPLAPHLKHRAGAAWFEPISLAAHVPARLSDAFPEEKRAYLHEYVHYLQAVSSFYGANRLHTFLRVLRALQESLKVAKGSWSALDRSAFASRVAQLTGDLDAVTADRNIEHDPYVLKTTEHLEGLWRLPYEDGHIVAVCRAHRDGYSSVFPVGAIAIQESQAMAFERWVFAEEAEPLYQLAKQADGETYAAFQYAAVTEALRQATSWDEDTLIRLTMLLCDLALDDYAPRRVLLIGVQLLHEIECPPASTADWQLLTTKLHQAVRSEEVEKERVKLTRELERTHQQACDSDSEFDHVMAQMIGLYLRAARARQANPTLFFNRLLNINDPLPAELADLEALPLYSDGRGTVSPLENRDLPTACLAFVALQHLAEAAATVLPQEATMKRCPLIDRPGACELARGSWCEEAPWLAPEENGTACIYRFAADALGVRST